MAKKKIKVKSAKKPACKWHAVPLKSTFMLIAILGFFISVYWIYPQSFNFGIAFMLLFAAMFIAALISMTKAPVVPK